jgi:hypothetical protein
LEPAHTDVVLVPGRNWGDESSWIDRVAVAIADGRPSATVLANGGAIAGADVERSLAQGRAVIVLVGTGRLADELAAAVTDESPRFASIAYSDLTTFVNAHDHDAVRAAVATILHTAGGNS